MERAVIRGKYDRDSETERIKIIVSAAPGTGGRARQRATNIWNEEAEFHAEFTDYLDTELPDNVYVPPA